VERNELTRGGAVPGMQGESGAQGRRIVLAYNGSLAASAAISWLAGAWRADVVTLTLDVGQDQPVEQLRARALACGAVRAHVLDARDEFARDCVVPSMQAAAGAMPASMTALVRPLVARKLVEMAAIEGATAVAHTSTDDAFHDAVAALLPELPVLAPVRDWEMTTEQVGEFARAHGIWSPAVAAAGDQHLLLRRASDPSRAPEGEARVELTFRNHVPVAINGVPMSAAELIESLSLIAGQYGVGWLEPAPAPAAAVLRSAYAALREPAGMVTVSVSRGQHVVLASDPAAVSAR